MSDAPRPITGRCLCGAVTYSADAEPVIQAACYCTDCQRQTGSPFSAFVAVPRDSLSIEGETLATYRTTGEDHGGETERTFCSACGSPLFSFSPLFPDNVFLKAGCLDDSSWMSPNIEAWTSSAPTWSPRFEGAAALERGPG